MPWPPNIRIVCRSPDRAEWARQALAAEGIVAIDGEPEAAAMPADIIITDGALADAAGGGDSGLIALAGGDKADIRLEPDASPRELALACRLLTQIVELRRAQRIHEVHQHRLEELAYLDALTELANRRAWDENLGRRVDSQARNGPAFCLALVDIDHFKRINDGHGHLVGDDVLRGFARALRAHVRDNDFVARLGGDEFGLLLPGVACGFAAEVVDRIRAGAIATACASEEAIAFTASAGYCCVEPPAVVTAEGLYAAADRALNRAKTTGRNPNCFLTLLRMPTPPRFPTTRTSIAGVSVVELVRQFGTPLYVYDAAKIVERVRDLAAFDVVRYAQKACSNIAILDLVRREGALVDTVSAGEIHRSLLAGYKPHGDPPPIVYTADIFDQAALETVLAHGIHVNCGSPDMIDQYGERAPGNSITLRVNPGFGHGHSQKTNTGGEHSKHGIWHEQLSDALRRADHHGLGVTGLHLHIGSGTDLEHLSQVCGAMERLATEVGRSLTTISAGGGLSVPYREEETYVEIDRYYKLWDATRKRLEDAFGHKLRLEIEPGRYLVAESGFLIAEIRAVKQMGGNMFYLLDAGFNNLARPILYGAYHPMSICPASEPPSSPRRSQEVVVGGPLCESGDIFTQEAGGFVARRALPAAGVGDFLVIEVAGAYGFVMASNYNSKPLPPEVLIRDQKPHLIRARQTVEDLTRAEQIPGS